MRSCKNCKTENDDNVKYCTLCSYPIGGTDAEQAKYIAKQIIDKDEVDDAVKRLRNARITLFLISAYLIILPIATIIINGATITLIVTTVLSVILGVVFLVFGILSFKFPKISLLIPLILISLFYMALLIISPLGLFFKGILWKILILSGLSYGYFSVRKSDRILKGNKYLASLVGFSRIK